MTNNSSMQYHRLRRKPSDILPVILLFLLGFPCLLNANALGVPDSEYAALVAMYNSTTGSGWFYRTNWLTNNSAWFGVGVSNGHVISISLPSNYLMGSIPNSIGDLTFLETLDLTGNHFTGTIPAQIWTLTHLKRLCLSSGFTAGPLSGEIGNLTNLEYLNLNLDKFAGPIPAQIGNLINLRYLSLGSNSLSGAIPSELSNLTNLQTLNLYGNKLTGALPVWIGNLSNLQNLTLSSNGFSGPLPSTLGNLTQLQVLDISDNPLYCPFPVELGNLTNLRTLYCSSDRFKGSIPASIGNLTNLESLSLGANDFVGDIPSSLSALTNLQSLDLESNWLTGSIPSWICSLSGLKYLSLAGNSFSGVIPDSIGNLTNLESLRLCNNLLVGLVPVSITNLTKLSKWWLFIEYNGLFTNDLTVDAFLASKEPGWKSSQTVAPTGLALSNISPNSATLTWNPILYSQDYGRYEVGFSSTSGGPYTFSSANWTSSKTVTSLSVKGLGYGSTYFVVRTITGSLTSLPSAEISTVLPTQNVASPAVVRTLPEGRAVTIDNLVVTASQIQPGFSFVQTPDGSSGIRIMTNDALSRGDLVSVSGLIRRTDSNAINQEYTLDNATTHITLTPGLEPVGRVVRTDAIMKDLGFQSGYTRLSLMGLLMTTCGRVYKTGCPANMFYIDDGCGLSDSNIYKLQGLQVRSQGNQYIPNEGDFVVVTGIVRFVIQVIPNSNLAYFGRYLNIRDSNDFVY